MNPIVTIIILNWNGWEDTIECIESVYQIKYPNYYLIVVDNGSNDDSIEKIRKYCKGEIEPKSEIKKYNPKYKPIRIWENAKIDCKLSLNNNSMEKKNLILLKNKHNYGFAEGNNIAMRYALNILKSDFILLLNNDTIVDNRFLDELVNIAKNNKKIGFVGPKTFFYNPHKRSNILSFAGGIMNFYSSQPYSRGLKENDNGQFENLENMDYLEGSCLLVKSEMINKIGLLDPDYFTYWEEIDWCIRGKKAGYESFYVPKAKIWHKGYGSEVGANSIYYMIKNRFMFIKKNNDKKRLISSLLYYFGFYFWLILFSFIIIHRNREKTYSLIKGTFEGIKIIIN